MTHDSSRPSRLRALVIGIDHYSRDDRPARGLYGDLAGAVRDACAMTEYLAKERKVPECRIRLLVSSPPNSRYDEDLPTYQNILNALDELRGRSRSGDRVLIHYSGHGGRIPALVPEIKPTGFDEALVPVDIAEEARYLRDVEIGLHLSRMLADGLHVTLVFDCCHADGAIRLRGVRGATAIDHDAPALASGAGTRRELIEAWRALGGSPQRAVRVTSGWFPNPRRYVLLAACREDQLAFERDFEAGGKNGVLTWLLLEAARRLGPQATCQQLHDRILGRAKGPLRAQTPQLEGAAKRVFLGTEERDRSHGITVLEIDAGGDVQLAAGRAHGVSSGSTFAVCEAGCALPPRAGDRLAVVRLFEIEDLESWAEVVETFGERPVERGDQAFPLEQGDLRAPFVHAVRTPSALAAELDREISAHGQRLLRPAADSEDADFELLAQGGRLTVRIRDQSLPALDILERGERRAREVVRKLVHSAKYSNLLRLSHPDKDSRLTTRVRAEFYRLPPSFDQERARRVKEEDLHCCGRLTDGETVEDGSFFCLSLANTADQALDFVILDFAPDWSLTQIHPCPTVRSASLLDGRSRTIVPMQAVLSPGYESGNDVVKIILTTETSDFRWLQLSPLGEIEGPRRAGRAARQPRSPLERLLFEAVGRTPPVVRSPRRTAGGKDWITSQISLRIVSAADSTAP